MTTPALTVVEAYNEYARLDRIAREAKRDAALAYQEWIWMRLQVPPNDDTKAAG